MVMAGVSAGETRVEIENPGFEEPIAYDNQIAGWVYTFPAESPFAVSIDSNEAHSGKTSLLIENRCYQEYVPAYNLIGLQMSTHVKSDYTSKQDEQWDLSHWIRTEGAVSFICFVKPAAAEQYATQWGKVINWWTLGGKIANGKTEWTKCEYLIELPKGAGFGDVCLSVGGKTGSKVWLDDFKLVKVRDIKHEAEPAKPKKIKRLVYLSHPYAWEMSAYREDPTEKLNKPIYKGFTLQELIENERKVSSRWPSEIKKLGPEDALVMNTQNLGAALESVNGVYGPVIRAAKGKLGGRFLITSEPDTEEHGRSIKAKLLDKGYYYDPKTLITEGWGQSFEGCLMRFGGRAAAGMGLPKGFPIRVEMAVPDAYFAMNAKFVETVAVGDTDVWLHIFEDGQGRCFGIYQCGLIYDTQPKRHAIINTKAEKLEFTNVLGDERNVPYTGEAYHFPLEYITSYEDILYIWGKGMTIEEFKSALSKAQIDLPAKPIKVEVGEPIIAAQGQEPNYPWGVWQFPNISRISKDELVVTYQKFIDCASLSAKKQESPGVAFSYDSGKNWVSQAEVPEHLGIWSHCITSSGDVIYLEKPQSQDISKEKLPAPVGRCDHGYGGFYTVRDPLKMPKEMGQWYIVRRTAGEKLWQKIPVTINDDNAAVLSYDGPDEAYAVVHWQWPMQLLEMRDGTLSAILYGFRLDENRKPRPKWESWCLRSRDGGKTWKFNGIIARDDKNPFAGFTEPVVTALPDGSLLSVLRTECFKTGPMYRTRSKDGGKTWDKPEQFYPFGVLPKLLTLENGVTVLSFGRPGVHIMFSRDGKGQIWENLTTLVSESLEGTGLDEKQCGLEKNEQVQGKPKQSRTSGYTDLIGTGPNSFIIVYDQFDYPDQKGRPRKTILVRKVELF